MFLGERKKKKKKKEKSGSVTQNFIWVSSTTPEIRKNWYNSKKMPWQVEVGQKEGQTLFHRTLPATRQMKSKITQVEANQVRYFF